MTQQVRLDFTYIPKNCYESETLFKIVNKCGKWTSPIDLDHRLTRKGFWDKQKYYKTKTRPSTTEYRGEIEVIRDCLDLAAYFGLLDKRFDFHQGRRSTAFRLTNLGKEICKGVNSKDSQIIPKLINCLISYAITNPKIDMKKYAQFRDFSNRPWFVLQKLLNDFSERYGAAHFHPKELGFVVFSVKVENENEFESALDKMYRFSRGGALTKSKKEGKMDFGLLFKYLRELGYESIYSFDSRTNNQITRLFRWAYYLGIIDCISSNDNVKGFFNLIDTGIAVKEILGLTDLGSKVFDDLEDTAYFSSAYAFYQTEIFLANLLTMVETPVSRRRLAEVCDKNNICDKIQFGEYVSHLREKEIIKADDKNIYLNKLPVLTASFFGGLVPLKEEKEKLEKIANSLKRIAPFKSRIIGETIIPMDEINSLLRFMIEKALKSKEEINRLLMSGIDPILSDYTLLAIGREELENQYSDIREVFEAKTATIFQQMGFDKVDHIGQRVGRGQSYPDVVAVWKRINAQISTHLTIIECKTHHEGKYSLTLTDLDRRVDQISNLIKRKEYEFLGSLIDTLLFVSSGFTGGYRDKLLNLVEKCRQQLRLNIRAACISAKDLLYLYARYRRNPRAFDKFNFADLFIEDLIQEGDINRIFNKN